MARVLYMLNKPFGILSQHSDEGAKSGWGRLDPPFGSDVYSIGRLDADSEGLLLFTNDNAFKTRMLDPKMATSERTMRKWRACPLPNSCVNLNFQWSFASRGNPSSRGDARRMSFNHRGLHEIRPSANEPPFLTVGLNLPSTKARTAKCDA